MVYWSCAFASHWRNATKTRTEHKANAYMYYVFKNKTIRSNLSNSYGVDQPITNGSLESRPIDKRESPREKINFFCIRSTLISDRGKAEVLYFRYVQDF